MKIKKLLIIIFIGILYLGNIVVVNAATLTDEQKALIETAKAYYRKFDKIQYCSYRRNSFFSPEEATKDSEKYMVCSGFTYNVYKQSLGLLIPNATATITAAAYNNAGENDIIHQWKKEDIDSVIASSNIDSAVNTFFNQMYNTYHLQAGDLIILLKKESGHVIMINDEITTSGVVTDANILHSTSSYEKVTNKITKGLSYNNNGTVQKGTLKTQLTSFFNSGKYAYLTIYRPLVNNNGKYNYYHCTLKDPELDSYVPSNFDCTKKEKTYEIQPAARSRIKYPDIDIDKVVSGVDKQIINNSTINIGDELVYTITVTNNSTTTYSNVKVSENISPLVDYFTATGENLSGKVLTYTIPSIAPGEKQVLTYTVEVKNDTSLINKVVESTGMVDDKIKTATIKNRITLDNIDGQKIVDAYNSLKSTSTKKGISFVQEVYEKASLGLDFTLNNFDITSLFSLTHGNSLKTIKLNEESKYIDYILNNYYGALFTSSDGKEVYLRYWYNSETYSDRATKIYKEHLKTGDILIYKNENDSITKENGEYAFIYVGDNFYGINSLTDGTPKNIYDVNAYMETGNPNNTNSPYLTTLLGKDYYVILRPSLETSISKTPSEGEEYVPVPNTNQNKNVRLVIYGSILVIIGLFLLIKKQNMESNE